jgi:hypothetical protein
MIEMSPDYAYPSSVGPVFDVATWSTRKTVTMALFAIPLGLLLLAAGLYFWNPNLLAAHLPKFLKSLTPEVLKLHKQYAWVKWAVPGGLGVFGFVFTAGGIASLADAFRADYYLRMGPGGIALRMPDGIDLAKFGLRFKVLALELAWNDVADWQIVQVKQLGSLSRNAGNLSGHLKLRTFSGQKHWLSLDGFREPAFIIHSKAQDALQMVPAFFGEPPAEHEEPAAGQRA